MKRIWFSLIAAGLLTIAIFAPATGEEAITVDLDEVDGSGVEGSARLVAADGQTEVEVLITAGLEEGAVHPVHIHEGTCDDLGDVAYPLEDIVDGVSESEVDAELADLMDGNHAINVHLSEDEMNVNVACGDIEEAGVGGPADDDDDAVADDEDDAVVDDEDDAVVDDEDDAVVDDEDDAVVDDEDDAVVDDEDDAVVDDEDDAVVDEDDDAVAEDDDDAVVDDEDDAIAEEEEADDVEDAVVPAAGSVGGPSGNTIALMVALMAGSALGFGVLIRRRSGRISIR
jgi:hypothetical protein